MKLEPRLAAGIWTSRSPAATSVPSLRRIEKPPPSQNLDEAACACGAARPNRPTAMLAAAAQRLRVDVMGGLLGMNAAIGHGDFRRCRAAMRPALRRSCARFWGSERFRLGARRSRGCGQTSYLRAARKPPGGGA